MITDQDAFRMFVHTPAESSSNYVRWAERLHADPGIGYGCVLDKVMIPLHPGDLMAVVSRPGHGKSSFMAYMARRTAMQLAASEQESRCVIYVSWEQSVEELEAFFESGTDYTSTDLAWGRVPMDTVIRGALERPLLPVWMVGTSMLAADKTKPPMTVEMVYAGIRGMRERFGLQPALICLDYLQIIPIMHATERIDQVSNATIEAKALALDLACPIIAGVQAARCVDKYTNPIPIMSDAQHSSAIEQTADKQIALWRPIKTEEQKPEREREQSVSIGRASYLINPELLVIRLLKQRFDIGYGTFAVRFCPQTLAMDDYETRSIMDE